MTGGDDPSPKGRSAILRRIRQFGFVKIVVVSVASIGVIAGALFAILEFPAKFNSYHSGFPLTREFWLHAHQWTGMYSSFPEGVVNMEDLNLSSNSDVVLELEYIEDLHEVVGVIHSGGNSGKGIHYSSLSLTGAPGYWARNTLKLDVSHIVAGRLSVIDRLRIERENPGGIITVSSTGPVLDQALRLSPDELLAEEGLESRFPLPRVPDNGGSRGTPAPD